MALPAALRRQICARFGLPVLLVIIVMAALLLNAGCGGNSSGAPVLKGNTLVTVAFTGTANDQLIQFDLAIQSITLTNKLGKTVSLVSGLQPTEYMHVNGGAEPLVTVSIPQDIYTAATATIGEADFSCSQLTPAGGLDTSTYSYGQTPQANVTVNLPAPITVTGRYHGASAQSACGAIADVLLLLSQRYRTVLDHSDLQFDSVYFFVFAGRHWVRRGGWVERPGFIHQWCRQRFRAIAS